MVLAEEGGMAGGKEAGVAMRNGPPGELTAGVEKELWRWISALTRDHSWSSQGKIRKLNPIDKANRMEWALRGQQKQAVGVQIADGWGACC